MDTTDTPTWHHGLLLGHPDIDEEHRRLALALDVLRLSLEVGDTNGGQDVIAVFNAVLDLTAEHFQREERLMHRLEYPGVRTHVRDHQGYLELLRRIRDMCASASADVMTGTLLGFSVSWFAHHVTTDDQALVRFLVVRDEMMAA